MNIDLDRTIDMEIDMTLYCTRCGIDMCHNEMCIKSRSDTPNTSNICKQCYMDYVVDFDSAELIRALPCLYCGIAQFRLRNAF